MICCVSSSIPLVSQRHGYLFFAVKNYHCLLMLTITALCAAGKELWWMFQPLDSALEGAMNAVDRDFGAGMGSKVMKVILLLIPLVCLILYVAYRTLSPSAAGVEVDFALPGNIFTPASPGVRKHNTTGKQH